jgi:hypothetical protein
MAESTIALGAATRTLNSVAVAVGGLGMAGLALAAGTWVGIDLKNDLKEWVRSFRERDAEGFAESSVDLLKRAPGPVGLGTRVAEWLTGWGRE